MKVYLEGKPNLSAFVFVLIREGEPHMVDFDLAKLEHDYHALPAAEFHARWIEPALIQLFGEPPDKIA